MILQEEILSSRVGVMSWLPETVRDGRVHFIETPKRLHWGTRLRYNRWLSGHSSAPMRQSQTRELARGANAAEWVQFVRFFVVLVRVARSSMGQF